MADVDVAVFREGRDALLQDVRYCVSRLARVISLEILWTKIEGGDFCYVRIDRPVALFANKSHSSGEVDRLSGPEKTSFA